MTFPEYQLLEALNLPKKIEMNTLYHNSIDLQWESLSKFVSAKALTDDPGFCEYTITAEGERGIYQWRRLLK